MKQNINTALDKSDKFIHSKQIEHETNRACPGSTLPDKDLVMILPLV
jgi:hypothetical protein